MARRIFIQFRTDLVPGEPVSKLLIVAGAACSKLLGRDFSDQQDFLYAQGEILAERARCHVLIDCDYHDSNPSLKDVDLYCYRVIEGEASW
jgi:hypothetical protein